PTLFPPSFGFPELFKPWPRGGRPADCGLRLSVAQDESNLLERATGAGVRDDLVDRDPGAFVERKSCNAGADRREGDRSQALLPGDLETAPGGLTQAVGRSATAQSHAGRVDHVARLEVAPARDRGVADLDRA